MSEKISGVVLYAIPVAVMIALIPLVPNDYILTGIYITFILVLLQFEGERNDLLAVVFGLLAITVSEYFFVMTGVETFTRVSFLGVMPLWLPFLWAYAFLTIKRALRILDR